jgi:hypothetical protein
MPVAPELPIIQHVYDLILWYVPRLNKIPGLHIRAGRSIQAQLCAFWRA